MNRIAEFSKVSFAQYYGDWIDIFGAIPEECTDMNIKSIHCTIELPSRKTSGSAGYDFKCPFDIELKPGESIKVPTGIRCRICDGWALKLYPRSSLGFRYRMQLDNTVGIIDSDYFYSSNEGHIIAKICNDSKDDKILSIKSGDSFIQGIFERYGITVADDAEGIRDGGFGSTGR